MEIFSEICFYVLIHPVSPEVIVIMLLEVFWIWMLPESHFSLYTDVTCMEIVFRVLIYRCSLDLLLFGDVSNYCTNCEHIRRVNISVICSENLTFLQTKLHALFFYVWQHTPFSFLCPFSIAFHIILLHWLPKGQHYNVFLLDTLNMVSSILLF